MTGLDERSAFDGRLTSDLMPTRCWSPSWPGPVRPSEWGIEAKHRTGEFALDLSVVDLAKACAAREAIETQPRRLCPPPPGTAIDRTVRELADSVAQSRHGWRRGTGPDLSVVTQAHGE
ncbi:hypothetical protein C3488_25455 [Streptomyces sp. Ru72]|nr:hypothetical protein C3488_25455 [Streptomyces sp. Ru72]